MRAGDPNISNEVTSLARIVQFTRADGVVARFTDHDEDIDMTSIDAVAAAATLTVEEVSAVAATDILTITATFNALNTETVVIDGKTYTWQSTLTAGDGHVKIGATLEDSLENLRRAIMLAGTAGTNYGVGTTVHPTVTAALVGFTNPDNTLAIAPTDPRISVKFGNPTPPLDAAFDGSAATFVTTPAATALDGLYVGYSFNTPVRIAKVVIARPVNSSDEKADPNFNIKARIGWKNRGKTFHAMFKADTGLSFKDDFGAPY